MTTTERNAVSSPANGLQIFNTSTSDAEFYDGAGWRTMDAGATLSDERLKTNLQPIDNSIEKLTTLRTVTYNWQDEGRGKDAEVGVIAQDVQAVYPDLVNEDGNGYLQVDYKRLTVPLIDAVKTLHARNNELQVMQDKTEQKLQAMQNQIDNLMMSQNANQTAQ
jgi:hypothetical protein